TRNITYLNQPIEPMDLPISNFEYNEFEDIKKVKKSLENKLNMLYFRWLFICIILFGIAGGILGVMDSNFGRSTERIYNSSTRSSERVVVNADEGERFVNGAGLGAFVALMTSWIPYMIFSPQY
ncbi:MAG TPA: hypothetical protein PLZ51_28330, partial [Aggregatilineales bacterium]|nr:hypothetical protein [Aggregatilineales bacterium]